MVTVAISVAGTDVTADVVFQDARFTSFVNGKPGEARMRVRDSDRTYSFATGADWLVEVDGNAAWRGFVQQVVETFIAPTGTAGPTRFFDLIGADYNLLFLRRVVENQSTPTNVAGTQFPPATADTTAITELLTNWLDLSSDDIDTTGGVVHVGDLDPAQQVSVFGGGWTWADAMNQIAWLPAAIYYLRPESGSPKATLCYVDVDAPTSPFGLSDKPNGTTTKGYREMEITLDGSSMANDVLAWGFGYGSNKPVFKRDQDATSITDHGVWQTPIMANGVYKQATINRMADSVLNGSPSSKRGAKNNRPYVSLVTYEPGLLAGHVVDFESLVWGFSDAIPVRQLTLLFEGPEVARYEIILSHEIDAPWSFFDVMKIPGFTYRQIPCPVWPCEPPPCPLCNQTDENCVCSITDTLSDRTTTSPDMGYATCGLANEVILQHHATVHVDGTTGVAQLDPSQGSVSAGASVAAMTLHPKPTLFDPTARHSIFFQMNNFGDPALTFAEIFNHRFRMFDGGGAVTARVVIIPSNSSLWTQGAGPTPSASAYSQITWTGDLVSGTQIPISFWSVNSLYEFYVEVQGSNLVAGITNGVTAYEIGLGFIPVSMSRIDYSWSRDLLGPYTTTWVTEVSFVNLDVPEVNRCSQFFYDGFLRTVVNAWGGPWGAFGFTPGDASVDSANGGRGRMYVSAFDNNTVTTTASSGPWTTASGFRMEAMFLTDFIPGTGEYTIYEMADDNFDVDLMVFLSSDSSIGELYVQSVGFFEFWKDDWQSFTFYKLAMEYTPGGEVKAKVWAFGDEDEPDWQAVTTAGPALSAAWNIIHTNTSSTNVRFDTYYLDFDYDGAPCYSDGVTPVGPVGTAPTGPFAWGCEQAERVSPTVYNTVSPFVPKSVFAWRDGVFQARGIGFTEDSGGQSITFASSVSSSEVVQVCYFRAVVAP